MRLIDGWILYCTFNYKCAGTECIRNIFRIWARVRPIPYNAQDYTCRPMNRWWTEEQQHKASRTQEGRCPDSLPTLPPKTFLVVGHVSAIPGGAAVAWLGRKHAQDQKWRPDASSHFPHPNWPEQTFYRPPTLSWSGAHSNHTSSS
jgi:hypothetical protein